MFQILKVLDYSLHTNILYWDIRMRLYSSCNSISRKIPILTGTLQRLCIIFYSYFLANQKDQFLEFYEWERQLANYSEIQLQVVLIANFCSGVNGDRQKECYNDTE